MIAFHSMKSQNLAKLYNNDIVIPCFIIIDLSLREAIFISMAFREVKFLTNF